MNGNSNSDRKPPPLKRRKLNNDNVPVVSKNEILSMSVKQKKQFKRKLKRQILNAERAGLTSCNFNPNNNSNGNSKRKSNPNIRCYRCQRRGHIARDCYSKKSYNKNRNFTKNKINKDYVCWNCGDKGHHINECPRCAVSTLKMNV